MHSEIRLKSQGAAERNPFHICVLNFKALSSVMMSAWGEYSRDGALKDGKAVKLIRHKWNFEEAPKEVISIDGTNME